MTISFLRIDERIIHGQVVVCWSRQFPCDGIIAVNDAAANNQIIASALKAATNIKTYVWTYETFLANKAKIETSNKNYFVITKEPKMMSKILVDSNLVTQRKVLNVGPQSLRGDAIKVCQETSITTDEIHSYEKIFNYGYDIQFQIVPDKNKTEWREIRQKLIKEG